MGRGVRDLITAANHVTYVCSLIFVCMMFAGRPLEHPNCSLCLAPVLVHMPVASEYQPQARAVEVLLDAFDIMLPASSTLHRSSSSLEPH